MGSDDLFKNRTERAAAVQLATVLAWATECELATVEHMKLLKRPPRGELKRHEDIAKKLVFHCRDLNVPPYGLMGRPCTRLMDELSQPLQPWGWLK